MKTKAAVLFECNQPLRIIEIEIPKLKPGQVLVDIAYSGVCHSQLNEINGLKGEDKYLPHTLGHEGSGVVLGIGAGVKKVKPGDNVVLTWIKGVGADVPSMVYQSCEGPINSGAISTFMEKTVVSENRLVPISKKMPLKEAALLGCAIPTGAGIVINNAKIKREDSVAIFGVGGIGLSAVMAASAIGLEKIIAIDVEEKKLELSKQIGATHTINASEKDSIIEIDQITVGKGVDYAIESAGRKDTMELAFQSVRNGGGKCIIAGNLPSGEKILIDPMDLIRGKNIAGTWGGETDPDKDIPEYVEWYQSGKMNLDKILTNDYPIEDINRAFDDLENGKVGRASVKLQPPKRMNGHH
jgi:S-(hydroxymethyl)glutathione dehydrogenase / alcohol dehydrogenase